MISAEDWIRILKLVPHPEGGFYREVYRSSVSVPKRALPARFGGARALSSSIYFLLRSGEVSRFHRLKTDEIWHFYEGSPALIHVISSEGSYHCLLLGRNVRQGELLQVILPARTWFGAEVVRSRSYTLAGCTVAPGFDFADFELARREDLLACFPRRRAIIERLTVPFPN